MLDLRIINGTVVSDGVVRRLDVGIDGGQITEIEEPGAVAPSRAEIDATGLHVIPGAVDVHFHCRAPSRTQGGDFASETAAAAAGGVTTVFEMPIAEPACSDPAVFESRRTLALSQSHVNFALYSGAVLGTADHAARMAELGAIGFKLFMIAPAPGRKREFSGLWATDEGEILDALSALRGIGLPCVVHAENERLVRHFAARTDADGRPTRPPVIEATAIATIAALAKEARADVHIAHVSSRAALDALRGARALGATVTAETCPQYLLLDAAAVHEYGAIAKIAPPLREREDAEALWQALRESTIELVASDHSPFPLDEKAGMPWTTAPQGLPTVELLVPTVLGAAATGRLPLGLAVSYVTAAPAKRFDLYPRKGALQVGSDADVALVRLGGEFSPEPDRLLTRAAGCAVVFAGIRLDARVELTLVGGIPVYQGGRLVHEGAGRFTAGSAALLEHV